jgi:predicted GTPase
MNNLSIPKTTPKSHENQINATERSVIVLGKTGAGKSNFLNQLLNTEVFTVSPSVESVTSQIQFAQREVTFMTKQRLIRSKRLHHIN